MEKYDLKPLPPVDSATNDLKQTPLWWETAPREGESGATLPRSADIVIIGAGYTGLSCALALARAGRSVTVIDSGARTALSEGGNACLFCSAVRLPLVR